jgi:hypothetical protein
MNSLAEERRFMAKKDKKNNRKQKKRAGPPKPRPESSVTKPWASSPPKR